MKYTLINGKLLDGTENMQVREGVSVLVENGLIKDIAENGSDLSGYEKIDLKGKYIMPGLINMHVHLAGNGKPQKKQRDNEKLVNKIMSTSLTPIFQRIFAAFSLSAVPVIISASAASVLRYVT